MTSPIGLPPGQLRLAIVSLMIATRGAMLSSCSVNTLPRSKGISRRLKYSGVQVIRLAWNLWAGSERLLKLSPMAPCHGSGDATAAFFTEGNCSILLKVLLTNWFQLAGAGYCFCGR